MTPEIERSKKIEGVGKMEAVDRIAKDNAVAENTESTEDASRRSWKKALRHELRRHPFGYAALGLLVLAGPLLAPLLFPQAPPAVAIVGGLAFGLYAAFCTVPQKFI